MSTQLEDSIKESFRINQEEKLIFRPGELPRVSIVQVFIELRDRCARYDWIKTSINSGWIACDAFMVKAMKGDKEYFEKMTVKATEPFGTKECTSLNDVLKSAKNSYHDEVAHQFGLRPDPDNNTEALLRDTKGRQLIVDAKRLSIILKRVPNATIHLPHRSNAKCNPIVFKEGNEIVGLLMALCPRQFDTGYLYAKDAKSAN